MTSSKSVVLSLQQDLKAAGAIVADVSLRGSFHNESHRADLERLIGFCDAHPEFQFLDATRLVLRTRSNTDGNYIKEGKLQDVVLRSMLTEQSDWHSVFAKLQTSILTHDDSLIVSLGPERCVPPVLARTLGPRLFQAPDFDAINKIDLSSNCLTQGGSLNHDRNCLSDNAIAVVGMACQLPGAADLEGFWKILRAGQSQHVEVPSHRFSIETAWRELDPKRKWYGNFIQDQDAFDHRFFKKSPREMESTDPQHRLMLQVAYQAVEQSGYFVSNNQDTSIGCYIGVGLTDYENNIACHPANAFSATGNLRSFAAGKISHYFGWTGPGITIDTACSSSAVAVHTACRAIIGGECNAALAGGVNIMTSPEWFQNLAGASFLSPTGQCKPFDAMADGYCRGEAVGAVFLKKLSSAIADGDQVYGVIAGSAVFQNRNCTPITVPNAISLGDLFHTVTRQTGLETGQISVVEAHGTGTPVGDPAEYDAIRTVFGGPARSDTLSLGSVKGLLGHAEAASGIVALLKTLLMIHEGAIPPQPSFKTINPSINASSSDKIEISTSVTPWEVDFRAALINNYGASGSNATLVVTQVPNANQKGEHNTSMKSLSMKHPFYFPGLDASTLRRYSKRFIEFLQSNSSLGKNMSIANLAFQLSRQSNRTLNQALICSCSSTSELEKKLTEFQQGSGTLTATTIKSTRPVVLCFGGQISTFVGLDRQIYESVKILRTYLDQCDAICLSLGLDSLYPAMFLRSPIVDIVNLQIILFAIQYSCAKSWIDCGVNVAAVVGHSFGELTALCVSGVLSLIDTLKMISRRARLIKNSWGADQGSMMAVEADLGVVEKLLDLSSKTIPAEKVATIACFNGPRNFTIAGSTSAIEMAVRLAATDPAFSSMKTKKLNVTNAFHSVLVEPFMGDLEQVGQGLTFREPRIPFERATEFETSNKFTSRFIAEHMREPVYFNHAIQRLSKRYPSCIWLEAGSNSTVTIMAGRALGSPKTSHFQPINITSDGAFQFLSEATAQLWNEGLNVSFWPHHPSQTSDYDPLFLPPYQFENARHWMELKKPQRAVVEKPIQPQFEELPKRLWTFIGYQDKNRRLVRFRVNTMIGKFSDFVIGHMIAQTAPLCPSTLQLDIAIDALMSLYPESQDMGLQPQLQGMDSHAPLSIDPTQFVWLDAEANENDPFIWDWKMVSNSGQEGSPVSLHVSGRLHFRPANDPQLLNEFEKYERLVDKKRCLRLLNSDDVDDVIQGRNIYKTFAEIVDYADVYRGVQRIVGKDNESAARIVKKHNGETWLDTGLGDSFCQVAGIFVNSMTDKPDTEMYISNRIDQWIRSPKLSTNSSRPECWEGYACHHRLSEKEYISDVFIFDGRNGVLLEVILGIRYQRVSKAGLGKVLSRLANVKVSEPAAPSSAPAQQKLTNGVGHPASVEAPKIAKPSKAKRAKKSAGPEISSSIKNLLSKLSGLEPHEIKDDSDLIDIGIDSLMGMELAREIEIAFKCTLENSDLMELTDFKSLVKCVKKTLGLPDDDTAASAEEDGEEEEDSVPAGGAEAVEQKPLVNNGVAHITNGVSPHINGVNGISSPIETDNSLTPATILEAFRESKQATDHFIAEYKLAGYVDHCLPKSTELCVAYIVEAFEKLGCSLRDAKPGQKLDRIPYLPKHEQLMVFIYDLLEKHARVIDIDGTEIQRTNISLPPKSAEGLLKDNVRKFPEHAANDKLTHLTSAKLAECLTGELDGLQLLFGTSEGREIASAMYRESPINLVWIRQIEDFLKRLLSERSIDMEPIKILEMGAGTGGTTSRMVPLLASLGVPVLYTVTDISSSLVATARKRFKEYPFMQFKVLDIEKPPPTDMLHTQHMILATNCVHATHSLVNSTTNLHNLLRSDGFLMMLEMTEPLPWVDLIFGLVEGWWLFDDGRRHALASPFVWQKTLHAAGYGHVDWTEGNRPEASVQRLIIALASSPRYDRAVIPPKSSLNRRTDLVARQAAIDAYVHRYIQAISTPIPSDKAYRRQSSDQCVVVTGATGSLGSHLVAYLAALPHIRSIVCLNRYSSREVTLRQREALTSRGLSPGSDALSKLKVFETDTSKPMLGLPSSGYEYLADNVTHIVHNAWPMSITRPIKAFESQFKVMQNLIELASKAASRCSEGPKIGFQFISSIATVGNFPIWSGSTDVPEERMTVESVLPTGYGDAKLVCEHMLEETLQKWPERFRPMTVRIGQIAGSKTTGQWNSVEHFAFMIKSAQTLKALPDLEGVWYPPFFTFIAVDVFSLAKSSCLIESFLVPRR